MHHFPQVETKQAQKGGKQQNIRDAKKPPAKSNHDTCQSQPYHDQDGSGYRITGKKQDVVEMFTIGVKW